MAVSPRSRALNIPDWAREPDGMPLGTREFSAGFRHDYDLGRVYGLLSSGILFTGAAAVFGALQKEGLQRHERAIAGAVGAVYTVAGGAGLLTARSRVPHWFQRRPRRALIAAAIPLMLAAPTGGGRSPLYRLLTVGAAATAAVHVRSRDGQIQAVLAGMIWDAQAAIKPVGDDNPWRIFVGIPLSFWASARLGAAGAQIAYDSRNLFDQLCEFAYEREGLEQYISTLGDALERLGDAVQSAAASVPAPGASPLDLQRAAVATLARLEERLRVLSVYRGIRFDVDRLVGAVETGDSDALDSFEPVVVTASALRSRLQRQADRFTDLRPDMPRATVLVADDVTVRGLKRLALVVATVTAGIANATRHAERPTALSVSVDRCRDTLRVTVLNDDEVPVDDLQPRAGLRHLERQMRDFGGHLEVTARPSGGCRVEGTLPIAGEPNNLEFWADRIYEQVEATLRSGAIIAAMKSIVTVLSTPEPRAGARRWRRLPSRFAAAHGAAILAGEAMAQWRRRSPGRDGFDADALLLAGTATLNYVAGARGGGLSTTWVNAAATRYVFDALPQSAVGGGAAQGARAGSIRRRAYAMAALNAASVMRSLRAGDRPRAGRTASDLFSLLFGPVLIAQFVIPAHGRTRMFERIVNERLAEFESLHELANSFHDVHNAPRRVSELAGLVDDPADRSDLTDALDAVRRAENSTPATRPRPRPRARPRPVAPRPAAGRQRLRSRRPERTWPTTTADLDNAPDASEAGQFGDLLARSLARRVSPAIVRLTFDQSTVPYAPSAAIHSAAFRRRAAAAMDVAGRGLNREFGRHIDGLWVLEGVDLRLSVFPQTGTITCEMVPWAPREAPWRQFINWMHDAVVARVPGWSLLEDHENDLDMLLEPLGAELTTWGFATESDLAAATAAGRRRRDERTPVFPAGLAVLKIYPFISAS